MMTLDAAYLSFDEKKKGSIEVGKLADLAILSDHLLTCDAERIKDIRAVATVVGGRVVHFTPQLSAEGAHQPQQEKRDAKTPLSDNRGLVRKRELEFRTASFHDSLDAIMKQIKTVAGAIVTTSDLEVLPNGKARARLVVRVPMERFDPFVLDLHRTLAKRAELTNDRTVTENVAKKQADLEARLRAARSMEVRISNLINYDKADKKDIAAAERELSAWQDKIKTMDQDKRRFDDLVALGTLAISLHEKDKSPVYRKFTAQKLEELLQEAKIEFDKDDGKSKETWHYCLEPRPRGSNLQIHLSNHEGLRLMIGVLFVGRISQKEVTEWNGRNRLSAVKYVKDRDPARSFFLEAMLDCEAGVTEADVLRFINRFDSEIKDFVEYLNK
jgi:hypothetical protein